MHRVNIFQYNAPVCFIHVLYVWELVTGRVWLSVYRRAGSQDVFKVNIHKTILGWFLAAIYSYIRIDLSISVTCIYNLGKWRCPCPLDFLTWYSFSWDLSIKLRSVEGNMWHKFYYVIDYITIDLVCFNAPCRQIKTNLNGKFSENE